MIELSRGVVMKSIIFGVTGLLIITFLFGCSAQKSTYTVVKRTDSSYEIANQKQKVKRDIAKSKEMDDIDVDWGSIAVGTLTAANQTLNNEVIRRNESLKYQQKIAKEKKIQAEVYAKFVADNQKASTDQNTSISKQSTPTKVLPTATNKYSNSNKQIKYDAVNNIAKGVSSSVSSSGAATKKRLTYSQKQFNNCIEKRKIDNNYCRMEKIAICYKSVKKNVDYWSCAGRTQFARAPEKGNEGLVKQLRYAGCENSYGDVPLASNKIAFYCGIPKGMTGNSVSTIEGFTKVKLPQRFLQKRKIYACPRPSRLDECKVI